MRPTFTKALRIVAGWTVLAAILACGGSDDDTAPPAPAPTNTTVPTPAPTPPAQAAPSPAAPSVVAPTSLTQISSGFLPDPQTQRGQAGGAMQASTLTGGNGDCRGWVPATPQHTLMLGSNFANLRVIVSSAQDTTLVVRGPDGAYRCADDSDMLNPIVEGAFAPGTYQIWVGAYSQGITAPYVIGFSELSSVTPDSLGT